MSQVAEIIRQEIVAQGPIPFSRFMELALYCPKYGYYEVGTESIGVDGDYYTSPAANPFFGRLIAFQLSQWMEQISSPHLDLVEAGLHRGDFARDILGWIQSHRPDLYRRLTYWAIEPSPTRQSWQRTTLAAFGNSVQWVDSLEKLQGQRPIDGVILANELLDAMPVQRLGWSVPDQAWYEWGVTWEPPPQSGFSWTRLTVDQERLAQLWKPAGLALSRELLAVLPDGFVVEWCPSALQWWTQALATLREGRLLTLDYGLEAEAMLTPERTRGTLRAYHRHQVSHDLLAYPGEQDLTAHVNWTSLRQAGVKSGWRMEPLRTQAQFLTDIARQTWNGTSGFQVWTDKMKRDFQTLTHPDHLGRAFQVLVGVKAT